jgi:hypothetical protein
MLRVWDVVYLKPNNKMRYIQMIVKSIQSLGSKFHEKRVIPDIKFL